MNARFIARGLLVALPAAAVSIAAGLHWMIARWPIGQPPGPTPLPPTIVAPHGELPTAPVGLELWAQFRGKRYVLSGSGFLVVLNNGEVAGVTAAHTLAPGDPARPLERIALALPGRVGFVAESDNVQWPSGARREEQMPIDCALLWMDAPVDREFVLEPDPRGAPQPGERVVLFGGTGEGYHSRRVLSGTVQAVGHDVGWVLMDDEGLNLLMMSGSPLLSAHTGQVVAMAVASTLRDYRPFSRHYRVLLKIVPIGTVLEMAEGNG